VNDILSQLRNEWLHLASLAIYSGGVYIVSRALRLSDERVAKNAAQIEKNCDQLASHARQIRDTRAALACCETALNIQHYPYTE
jgi:hypothetical protein